MTSPTLAAAGTDRTSATALGRAGLRTAKWSVVAGGPAMVGVGRARGVVLPRVWGQDREVRARAGAVRERK